MSLVNGHFVCSRKFFITPVQPSIVHIIQRTTQPIVQEHNGIFIWWIAHSCCIWKGHLVVEWKRKNGFSAVKTETSWYADDTSFWLCFILQLGKSSSFMHRQFPLLWQATHKLAIWGLTTHWIWILTQLLKSFLRHYLSQLRLLSITKLCFDSIEISFKVSGESFVPISSCSYN